MVLLNLSPIDTNARVSRPGGMRRATTVPTVTVGIWTSLWNDTTITSIGDWSSPFTRNVEQEVDIAIRTEVGERPVATVALTEFEFRWIVERRDSDGEPIIIQSEQILWPNRLMNGGGSGERVYASSYDQFSKQPSAALRECSPRMRMLDHVCVGPFTRHPRFGLNVFILPKSAVVGTPSSSSHRLGQGRYGATARTAHALAGVFLTTRRVIAQPRQVR